MFILIGGENISPSRKSFSLDSNKGHLPKKISKQKVEITSSENQFPITRQLLVHQIRSILAPATVYLREGAIVLIQANQNSFEKTVFPLTPNLLSKDYISFADVLSQPNKLTNSAFSDGIKDIITGQRKKEFIYDIPEEFRYNPEHQPSAFKEELFFLAPNCSEYFLSPIAFLGLPILFLAHANNDDSKSSIYKSFYNRLQWALSSYVHQALISILQKEEALMEIHDEMNLVQFFTNRIAQIIIPISYSINGEQHHFINEFPFGKERAIKFLCGDIEVRIKIHCPFPLSTSPILLNPENPRIDKHDPISSQINYFENYLSQLYSILKKLWDKSRQSFTSSTNAYLIKLQKEIEEVISPITQLQETLKGLNPLDFKIRNISNQGIPENPFDFPFAFFPLSTGWIITFNGKLVNCKGAPEKGLKYIQKILRHYPNVLTAFDFEYVSREGEADVPVFKILDDKYQVIFDPARLRGIPEDLDGLLKQISRLEKEIDGHELEDKIMIIQDLIYWSYTLSLHHQRYKILIDKFKKDLEDKIVELRIQYEDDEAKIHEFLKQTKIIEKPPQANQDVKKLRWRISKDISYAVKKMDDSNIQEHLTNCIKKGRVYKYEPDQKIDWYLGPNG